jgi:hypothetical protein
MGNNLDGKVLAGKDVTMFFFYARWNKWGWGGEMLLPNKKKKIKR